MSVLAVLIVIACILLLVLLKLGQIADRLSDINFEAEKIRARVAPYESEIEDQA